MARRKSVAETWSIEDTPDGWVLHVRPRTRFRALSPETGLGWFRLALTVAFSLLLLANSIENPFRELPLVFAVPFAALGVFIWWLYLRPPLVKAWAVANEVFELRVSGGHFEQDGGVYDAHVLKTLRLAPASRPGRNRLVFDGDVIPDVHLLSEEGVNGGVAKQVRDAVLERVLQGC